MTFTPVNDSPPTGRSASTICPPVPTYGPSVQSPDTTIGVVYGACPHLHIQIGPTLRGLCSPAATAEDPLITDTQYDSDMLSWMDHMKYKKNQGED